MYKYQLKKIKKNFKPGVEFIIKSKPMYWSSKLNKNNPFDQDIEYPYYGKIKCVDMSDEDYLALDDGIYGWSLSNLIENDLIIIDKKKIRKKKIIKLNNIEDYEQNT